MNGVNIPSIPASVDPNVRQAINELKARIVELQALVGSPTENQATTTIGGVEEAPQDNCFYVRRNGQWEVLQNT